MITTKTVFVLGAGASHPFGFPLGVELKQRVLENYRDERGHAVHLYNTTKLRENDVSTFVDGLSRSGLSSVDAFLERRPNFLEVGKATMGIELLYAESSSNLWYEGSNWLTHLYRNMVGGALEEFASNQVSFVTFNYDRTVECFLHDSLFHSFGKGSVETAKIVDQIPIIHLHGRLGFLPWQATQNIVPYGKTEIDGRIMRTMLDEVKVVHEDITDVRDREFTRARDLLGKADRVYLLGFGFGARNVERLGLDSIEPIVFQGTSYRMTPKESRQCMAMSGGRVELHHNYDALDFLRNVASLN